MSSDLISGAVVCRAHEALLRPSRTHSLITFACLCFFSRALLKLLEVTDIFETLMKGTDPLPRKRHVQYFACNVRGSIKLPGSPEESIDLWLRTHINSGFEDIVRQI